MGYGGHGDWVNWSDEELAKRRPTNTKSTSNISKVEQVDDSAQKEVTTITQTKEHVFKSGDKAYHVVRREIVTLALFRSGPNLTDEEHEFTPEGYHNEYDTIPGVILLPPWHPDVPERCRLPKPKRKVEVVRWVNIYPSGSTSCFNSELAARKTSDGAIAIAVEVRGSYEVDE